MRKILKFIKFYPYKVKLVQKLNDDYPDRHLEFCDLMMGRIDAYQTSCLISFFSEEATFELSSQVNRHNFRYWSDSNPHWADILNDVLIGPIFIDGNLTAEKYKAILREPILPAIRQVTGENFVRKSSSIIWWKDTYFFGHGIS